MATTPKTYDAIVVGTGAAGGWAAKELTEGGMNVLALEAGRAIDKAVDFPEDLEPVEMNMFARVGFALRGQHVQAKMTGTFGSGFSHFYVNDRENPYSNPLDAPFSWFRSRQVGGRMHTWARVALRLSEFDLKRPDLDPALGASWPLSYEDIAPCYSKVEKTLGIIGNQDGVESPPDGEVLSNQPPIPPSDKIYSKLVAERTGIKIIRSRVIEHNTDRTFLPLTLAAQTGNLDLQPDAVVHRILIDSKTGKARGVGYYDRLSKAYSEVSAETVVLCASAFESVRILLNSACPRHPDGVGASSGSLGRYILDHVLVPKGGFTSPEFVDMVSDTGEEHVPIATDPYDLGAYSMYIPNFCRTLDEKPDFVGGYGVQTSATKRNWWMMFFGQMVPRAENRVTLHPRRKDKWGIPIAHIEARHGENEFKMAAHMNETASRVTEQLGFSIREGGGRVARGPQALVYKLLKPMAMQKSGAMHPGAAIHETGGARMGSDPEKSVLNSYCQCWDVPNVYVTDGASFPSNGCQNHTLTIMAQTVRACEHILNER
jgi:choline dehydrogenase-like flavoprotein|tara:strand:+ start:5657 stop:7288 length:1632 start_codon:yes stop_codon:yes gene_type:complete